MPVSKMARVVSTSTCAGDGQCIECRSSVRDVYPTIDRFPKDVGKIRPSVALPTGTAIGQTKDLGIFTAPQPFRAFHRHAPYSALTQQLLHLSGNTLDADRL